MLILKAYKFRLYPNDNQKILINKTLGCTRFIYNYFLDVKQKEYELTHKSRSAFDCCNEVKTLYKDLPWLKEVDSTAIRCSIFDLDNAFNKMYKEKSGYPKFKKKDRKNSYRTNYIKDNIRLNLEKNIIRLPKLKEIKIRGYRNIKQIEGRIINATISKEPNGKYYVSVLVEEENKYIEEIKSPTIIGIDLGIKNLVTTSNHEKINKENLIKKYEKRIIRYQRRLSKKVKGSKNYYKAKQKLARLYSKLRNARKYILHEISKKLTDENYIIVTEKLNIKNMVQNRKLSKHIQDSSWNELIRQLEYKTKWKNKKLYQIDRYYPSSQICSKCGYQEKEIKDIGIREWICKECLSENDRDNNAAENILFEGIKMYIKRME